MSFTIFNGFNFGKVQTQNVSAGGGAVGGWVELGRTTLGSASNTITVSSLADKRYYMVLMNDISSGNTQWYPRLGNASVDSGSNYSTRESYNGAADITTTSGTSIRWNTSITSAYDKPKFGITYISNYSTKEKLSLFHGVAQNTAGAGTTPDRAENVGKWVNTSNPLNVISLTNIETGNYGIGSEVVVLGYDPADTHTTNFWEELANDTRAGGSTSTFTSSTFTAKKYLWIQCYIKNGSSSARNALFRFNGDSGNNYAHRRSENGGADLTQNTQANGVITSGFTNETGLINMFILNNSANEKLVICHSIFNGTSGAGNAPNRTETVSKWVNTSSQITSFSLIDTVSSDAFADGSMIKVWGSS